MKKLNFLRSALHSVAALLVVAFGATTVSSCEDLGEETPEDVVAVLTPSEESLTFNAGEDKTVTFESEHVTEIVVKSYPKGWTAEVSEDYSSLKVTAPGTQVTDLETSGVIVIEGTVSDGTTISVEIKVEVVYPDSAVTVKVSEDGISIEYVGNPAANTVYYGAVPASEYSAESVIAAIETASTLTPGSPISGKTIDEILGAEAKTGVRYIIWAVVKTSDVSTEITAEDIVTAKYDPKASATVTVTEATALAVNVKIETEGAAGFLAGYDMAENIYDEYFTSMMGDWSYFSPDADAIVANASYEGSMGYLGHASYDGGVQFDTDYIIYVLPIIDGKDWTEYTVDDFVIVKASTAALQPGGSAKIIFGEPEITFTSASVALNVGEGALKVYGEYMDADTYASYADDAAIVSYLTGNWPLMDMTLSNYYLSPESTGYFVAVAVDNTGKYGEVAKMEVKTPALVWSDAGKLSIGETSVTATSVSIPYELTGTTATAIKYINTTREMLENNSWAGWTDQISDMESIIALANENSWDVITLTGEAIASPLEITGLTSGAEYLFFMIALDANGNPVHGAQCTYTPGISADDLISSNATGYDFGKPTVEVTAVSIIEGTNFYSATLNVTVSADCKEYYVLGWDPEYGTDAVKIFYSTLSEGIRYEGSQEAVPVDWINSSTLISIAWLDSNDKYHEQLLIPVADYITAGDGGTSADDSLIEEK